MSFTYRQALASASTLHDGQDAGKCSCETRISPCITRRTWRGRYEFFQPDMNVGPAERQSLEDGMRRALYWQEFVLHYQPKMDSGNGRDRPRRSAPPGAPSRSRGLAADAVCTDCRKIFVLITDGSSAKLAYRPGVGNT